MNLTHQGLIDRVRSSSAALQRTVEAIPADLLDKRPAEEEWSALETLVHVRNVAIMVYGLRLRRLLHERDPLFANYEEDPQQLADSVQREKPADILKTIVLEHEQLALLLNALPEDGWQRAGRHAEYGPMTIAFLAQRVADHAMDHVQQIANAAGAVSE